MTQDGRVGDLSGRGRLSTVSETMTRTLLRIQLGENGGTELAGSGSV